MGVGIAHANGIRKLSVLGPEHFEDG
jgi:hypothetical protein